MTFRVRAARPGDEHTLFTLIRALARYEKLEHTVTGNAEQLKAHLFGPAPVIQALLAESDAGAPLGFALFFSNYSTFLTSAGIYLEDLFVIEEARSRGVGRALLREVARIALERGAGRLEWTVLDWNAKAIGFYEGVGASVLADWRVCRVVGEGIALLARGTGRDAELPGDPDRDERVDR